MVIFMSDPINDLSRKNRRHFWVDINTVLKLFGKRYFLIFYFGRHLHPRQRELVNQRTWGNWLVIIGAALLLAGFAYGAVEMVLWRMGPGAPLPNTGSFT